MATELDRLRQAWTEIPPPSEHTADLVRSRLVAYVRARRGRIVRRAIVVAVAILALLAAVPALSGNGYHFVVSFLGGTPPKPVVEDLNRLDQGAPPGMEQRPIVAKTGKVYDRMTRFGRVQIWLTPTKTHRLCESFLAPDAHGRIRPYSGGCFPTELQGPIQLTGSGGGTDFAASFLEGRVATAIVRLQLRYVNGGLEDVPVENGFFVAAVDPVRSGRLSDHPHELTGFDRGGKLVATERLDEFYGEQLDGGERPPVAIVAEERKAIEVALGQGSTAALYLSPSRAGGSCARVASAGVDWSWLCADPETLPNPVRIAEARVPTGAGAAVLLFGVVRPGYDLDLRYEDGRVEHVPLEEGNFLVAIAADRFPRGRRLAFVEARAAGATPFRIPIATQDDALYSGPPDRPPGRPHVQIYNPTDVPITASLDVRGEHGDRIRFFVRRESETKWYQVVEVDGRVVAGENLQWFPGGHQTAIGGEWIPLQTPDVPHDLSLLVGHLYAPGAAVRLVFADGSTDSEPIARPEKPLANVAAFYVVAIGDADRARHPVRLEALDAAGKVIGTTPVPRGA